MRLADLHPNWWTRQGDPRHLGVLFDCPLHGESCSTIVGVQFINPIGGGQPPPDHEGSRPTPKWQREGESFDDLTLTPSIHVQYPVVKDGKTELVSHWHGHVTKGEVA